MATANLDDLRVLVDQASSDLPDVTGRRMFGCHALFARGSIYALVWKTGRIGVKLTDEALFAEAMRLKGADPWTAGTKQMSHWVLLPTSVHSDTTALRRWVREAHALASASASGAQTPRKKKAEKGKGQRKPTKNPKKPPQGG